MMRPVCVVGAGTMGRGIAQVALTGGHDVVLCDPDAAQLTDAVDEIDRPRTRKDPSGAAACLKRRTTAPRIEQSPDLVRPLVIEAVVEQLDTKVKVFTAATERFGAETILATNTSSLSVTEIAA